MRGREQLIKTFNRQTSHLQSAECRGRRGRVCLGGVAALRWSNRCRFSCSSDEAPARYRGGRTQANGRLRSGVSGLCWREKPKQIHVWRESAAAAGVPTAAARPTVKSRNPICSAPGRWAGPRSALSAVELTASVCVCVCVKSNISRLRC